MMMMMMCKRKKKKEKKSPFDPHRTRTPTGKKRTPSPLECETQGKYKGKGRDSYLIDCVVRLCAVLCCAALRTSVEEQSVSLSSLEVERDLIAAADNRLSAILCHVVEQVLVASKCRFRRLLACANNSQSVNKQMLISILLQYIARNHN